MLTGRATLTDRMALETPGKVRGSDGAGKIRPLYSLYHFKCPCMYVVVHTEVCHHVLVYYYVNNVATYEKSSSWGIGEGGRGVRFLTKTVDGCVRRGSSLTTRLYLS